MKRDPDALASHCFDVLIIGGGIYGACIARDAALRGLDVALVEQSDFSSGTSHNSLKIVHGGIRYLQHLDFKRVRESIVERRIWLTIAPHLVRPLEFIIPTQGYLARGPMALYSALLLHRMLGYDWNRGVPPAFHMPLGSVSGKTALRKRLPGLPPEGLSGAASWHDGQIIDADRVVLECLQSAVNDGAVVANHLAASSLLTSNGKVCGAAVVDQITGREIEIRARVTVNAAGPWIGGLLEKSLGTEVASSIPALAKNMNIVVKKKYADCGVGVPSKRSSDAIIGSESRLFFITPWKDVSVIGTTHFPYNGNPDEYSVTEEEVEEFLSEVNASYPPAKLSRDDVLYVYSGLTPAESGSTHGEVGRSRRAEIVDHGVRHGWPGLLSVVGVKYTTSRLVAERVTSLVQKILGQVDTVRTARSRLLPGAIGWSPANRENRATVDATDELLEPYGSMAPVAASADFDDAFSVCAKHAARTEMALTLDDFLLRRNDFAARGKLTGRMLATAAEAMGKELNWSADELELNCHRVRKLLRYPLK